VNDAVFSSSGSQQAAIMLLDLANGALVHIRRHLNVIDLASRYSVRLPCHADQKKHKRAWNLIFEKRDWLKRASELGACPTLIGTDLPALLDPDKAREKAHLYLLLADFDQIGDLRFDIKLFFDCLRQPYKLDQERWEVRFGQSVTLAIHGIKWGQETTLVDTERLFTHDARPENVSTCYMFWDNPKVFRTSKGNLGSQGDPSFTKPITQALTLPPGHPHFYCVFKLKHPDKGPMGWLAVEQRGAGQAPVVQDVLR
jgi:hypothetical protein